MRVSYLPEGRIPGDAAAAGDAAMLVVDGGTAPSERDIVYGFMHGVLAMPCESGGSALPWWLCPSRALPIGRYSIGFSCIWFFVARVDLEIIGRNMN